MPTANDLISRALRKAGILETGQTALANDSLEALDTLNDILDQWSLEDLMIVYTSIIEFPLVAGQLQYSIGSTGNIIAVRPIELITAWVVDNQNINYPLSIVDFSNYQSIIQKVSASNNLPSLISYQPSYPLGQLYLWQSPSAGFTLRLEVSQQFIRLASLATEINDTFPVGYAKALVDCLAYELCLEYGHSEMLAQLQETATTSKLNIKRKNTRETFMTFSNMFLQSSQTNSSYNIFSDTDRG
jgi:hypothetical protein